MIETFREISYCFEKSGKCSACGKRRKRRTKIAQTLNPFNKRADGAVKTEREIADEIVAKGRAWEREPLVCASCEGTQRAALRGE